MHPRTFIPLAVALLAVLAAIVPAFAHGGETLSNVRDATAAYNDPSATFAGRNAGAIIRSTSAAS